MDITSEIKGLNKTNAIISAFITLGIAAMAPVPMPYIKTISSAKKDWTIEKDTMGYVLYLTAWYSSIFFVSYSVLEKDYGSTSKKVLLGTLGTMIVANAVSNITRERKIRNFSDAVASSDSSKIPITA